MNESEETCQNSLQHNTESMKTVKFFEHTCRIGRNS